MKFTPELLIKLSMIIDKMEIADKIAKIEKGSNEEVGKAVMAIIFSKIYKAENEIYAWIAEVKEISIDDAKKVDLFLLISEFKKSEFYEKLKPFLPLAQD